MYLPISSIQRFQGSPRTGNFPFDLSELFFLVFQLPGQSCVLLQLGVHFEIDNYELNVVDI